MTKQEIFQKLTSADIQKVATNLDITTGVVEKLIKIGNFEIESEAEEVIYDRELEVLKRKLKSGDYTLLGEMMNIGGNYAQKIISRKTAKKHPLAMKMLKEIIETRESLKEKSNKISVAV